MGFKVTRSLPSCVQNLFNSCFPFSKVTKIALGALGLFTAALIYIGFIILRGRVSKSPDNPPPKDSNNKPENEKEKANSTKVEKLGKMLEEIDSSQDSTDPYNEIVKLLGGRLEWLPDIQITSGIPSKNPVETLKSIASIINEQKSLEIATKAIAHNYQFFCVSYKIKNTVLSKILVIYSVTESNHREWYLGLLDSKSSNEGLEFIFKEDYIFPFNSPNGTFMKQIISGRNTSCQLQKVQIKFASLSIDNSKLGFPPEIIKIMGGETKFNQIPMVFKSDQKQTQPVGREKKYETIKPMFNAHDSFRSVKSFTKTNIVIGKDAWECAFLRINYVKKDSPNKPLFVLIYSIRTKNKPIKWFIDKEEFSLKNQKIEFIERLVNNRDTDYQLGY